MRTLIIALVVSVFVSPMVWGAAPAAPKTAAAPAPKIVPPWPGKKGRDFSGGFAMYNFTMDGVRCIVVAPKTAAPGKPWIWRARFFGHQPQADRALLGKGFHVAYCDVGGLFGSPAAVARWNRFHAYLTTQHGFSTKPALEGMSRGGLIIYNWAAANPTKVACIYGDAPVMDFKSWPGVGGILKVYGFKSKDEANAYKGNPVDSLAPLAKAGVPILHVVGDADKVVPVSANTAVAEKRYKEMGGQFTVIHKAGVGHHPHSLKDPKPIVDFVLKYALKPVKTKE